MKKWILIIVLAIVFTFFLLFGLSWLATPVAHARDHHHHGHHHYFGIWISPPVIRVLPPVYYRPYYPPPYYYPSYREWMPGRWEWNSYYGRWIWVPGYWRWNCDP